MQGKRLKPQVQISPDRWGSGHDFRRQFWLSYFFKIDKFKALFFYFSGAKIFFTGEKMVWWAAEGITVYRLKALREKTIKIVSKILKKKSLY